MLLERSAMPVADAVKHLVGLQAQIPTDPYFALWSRLADFDPQTLSGLIETRKAVRMASLRGTLHLMTAADALPMRALVQPVLTRMLAGTPFGKATKGVDVEAVIAVGRAAVETQPMTLAGLRPVLADAFPDMDATSLSYVFHYRTPLVQVPPRGLWGKSGAPRVTTAESWFGRKGARPSAEKIVLRYLAAFGPASVMDAQAWSGLTRLGAVFEKLRPRLVTFRDEAGRELFDLPDAPRPDADTPAPPRFLPVYDNATLGFANRDRIVRGGPKVPVPQSVVVRTFLVDGFTAGLWNIVEDKRQATLMIEPFGKLTKAERYCAEGGGDAAPRFCRAQGYAQGCAGWAGAVAVLNLSEASGWLTRVNGVPELGKRLPAGFDRCRAGLRHIRRGLDLLHDRDVARAVGKDRRHRDADDELGADRLGHQRIVTADGRAAVDAQPAGPGEIDAQKADTRIDADIAQALEHAVPVVVGEREFGRTDHPDEARRAALERAIRPARSIRCREKEESDALDECAVALDESGARGFLLEPVGDAPAVERILQGAVTIVVQDRARHRGRAPGENGVANLPRRAQGGRLHAWRWLKKTEMSLSNPAVPVRRVDRARENPRCRRQAPEEKTHAFHDVDDPEGIRDPPSRAPCRATTRSTQ